MDILIDDIHGSHWVAAIKDMTLHGIEIDPVMEGVRWGSLYWARISRIDKRMNAAFLDLGHGEQGILYLRDIRPKAKASENIQDRFNNGDMVFVQAKTSTLPLDLQQDFSPDEQKVARMSMDIAIPGRFLIYTPFSKEKVVSSRVKDKALRSNMLKMLDKIEAIDGCILRSSAGNIQTDVLIRESKILKKIWDQLQEFQRGEVPSLIMEGPNAFQRLVGDMAHEQIETIITTSKEQFGEIEEWCDIYAPDLVPKVRISVDEEDISLLDSYDMLGEIEGLLQPYALLANGAAMIIQETNALTAIDVNLAAANSKADANIAAAKEIPRQLRLRNIGGAVIIDFINIKEKKIKEQILNILKEESRRDPCSVDVHDFTNLGFVELTRARRTPPLAEQLAIATSVVEE